MIDNPGLEKALQATLEQLVEDRLVSLRQELTAALQQQISAATGGGATTVAASARASGVPELNQAVARILQPTGQTEIMGALLQGAAGFSGRCVLFVRRGDAFAFWRAEHFKDDAIAAARSLNVDPSGIFKDILDTQRAVSTSRAPGTIPAALDQALGQSADSNVCVAPVIVHGRVVAALYADSGTVAGPLETSAVEILAKVTGLSLETAATRAAVRPAAAASAGAAKAAEQPQPAAVSIQEPAPVTAQAPRGSFAASIPPTPVSAPSVEPPPDAESLPDADREAHRKAHRFARVAVQDLLSYHKNKIEQGRQHKNLYAILKDDIEKTRENYRQRFGNTAARSYDYLHYELVLKLAGNDPEALGATYPGAMQEK